MDPRLQKIKDLIGELGKEKKINMVFITEFTEENGGIDIYAMCSNGFLARAAETMETGIGDTEGSTNQHKDGKLIVRVKKIGHGATALEVLPRFLKSSDFQIIGESLLKVANKINSGGAPEFTEDCICDECMAIDSARKEKIKQDPNIN